MEHHFNPEHAQKYGIVEAILLNHLLFWIEKNSADDECIYEGRVWTYASAKSLSAVFSYLTAKQIRTALNHLEDEGVIISDYFGNLNRTKWYAFVDQEQWLPFLSADNNAAGNDADDADEDKKNAGKEPAAPELPIFDKNSGDLGQKQPAKSDGYAIYQKGKCNLPKGKMQVTKRENVYKDKDKSIKDNTPITPTGVKEGAPAEKPESKTTVEADIALRKQFDIFRKAYKGTVRGLDTEFDNLRKRFKNWRDLVPLLLPAYRRQQDAKQALRAAGHFVPCEKNLKTYINQRCWEEEIRGAQTITVNINTHIVD